jgi:hypothetical protein
MNFINSYAQYIYREPMYIDMYSVSMCDTSSKSAVLCLCCILFVWNRSFIQPCS